MDNPPIPSPDQTPVKQLSTQKSPLILPLLIAILLVLLGTTAFLAYQNMRLQGQITALKDSSLPTPTPELSPTEAPPTSKITVDPKTGWNLYQNDEQKLSFEFPITYTLSENVPQSSAYYIALMSPLSTSPRKGYELQSNELKIEIYINQATSTDSLDQIISDEQKNANDNGATILKTSPITVGGVKGIYQDVNGLGVMRAVYLLYQGKKYNIVKYPLTTDRQQEYDQILSTFKFLGQTSGGMPKNYEDCLNAPGSRLQESYPATCVTSGGQSFVQPLTDEQKKNLEPPSNQSCQYKGKTYQAGESVPSGDTCNSCSCDNGQVACTTMACL